MNLEKFGVGIIGTGKFIPSVLVTNEEIEKAANLPVGYIEAKTGIKSRFIAAENETASEISLKAAQLALEAAGVEPSELGLILGCTFTADYRYPALACKVHSLLGAKGAAAYDLIANCAGSQVGIATASDRMRVDKSVKYGLVIGVTLQSRFINWKDPNSAIYFGDGAGALVLGPVPEGYGVLANEIFSHTQAYDAVRLRGGGASYPPSAQNISPETSEIIKYYEVNEMEVWKQVVQYLPTALQNVLKKIDKSIADVDFFVFHQANLRLIEFLMAKLKVPMAKTYINVTEFGNTADASIAIALDGAVRAGKIKRDSLVVIAGVGAGFTFGATAIRWY